MVRKLLDFKIKTHDCERTEARIRRAEARDVADGLFHRAFSHGPCDADGNRALKDHRKKYEQ